MRFLCFAQNFECFLIYFEQSLCLFFNAEMRILIRSNTANTKGRIGYLDFGSWVFVKGWIRIKFENLVQWSISVKRFDGSSGLYRLIIFN